MRKLTLKLEELEVETFATDGQRQAHGTVHAHEDSEEMEYSGMTYCYPYCVSCLPECHGQTPGTEMTYCLPECVSCMPECYTYDYGYYYA